MNYRSNNTVSACCTAIRRWTGLAVDERGASAIMFGLILPALIGFVGLALDAVFWLDAHNKQQAATDQTALTVAHSLLRNSDQNQLHALTSQHLAKIYGDDYSGYKITVNNPPLAGQMIGDATAVELIVRKWQPVFFLKLFGLEQVRVSTRAVSRYNTATDYCILALDQIRDRAASFTGSSDVDLDCGIASNSTSMESVYMSGSVQVSSPAVTAVGDILVTDSASLNDGRHPLMPYSPPITDPYGPAGRNLQVPQMPTSCTERNTVLTKNTTLKPGRYCGGLHIAGGNIKLKPGTYIIDKGDLKVVGGASFTGTDVTIVLTGSGKDYAGLDIAGDASLSLHAPSTDPMFKGVLFFQDPDAPTYQGNKPISNKLNGNSDMALTGAVYFPSQQVDFQGATGGNTSCLQLVARTVTFSGSGAITNSCASSSGTETISRFSIKLVE